MKNYRGFGIKIIADVDVDYTPRASECHLKEVDKIKVNCKHYNKTNGECKNNLFYHYCKHIARENNTEKIKKLIEINFMNDVCGINENFNKLEESNSVNIIKQYITYLDDYKNSSDMIFPKFEKKHKNGNYIPIAFAKNIEEKTPIMVIGKKINTNSSYAFNTFYFVENILFHYNFFIAFASELNKINIKSSFKFDSFYSISSETDDININNVVVSLFENPLLVSKYRLNEKLIIEKYYHSLVKNDLLKDKGINYQTLLICDYLLKKFSSSPFESKVNALPESTKKEIFDKFKDQPESIFKYLNSKDKLISETDHLFGYSLFYSLLLLTITAQNESDKQKIIDLMKNVKEIDTIANQLIDKFL